MPITILNKIFNLFFSENAKKRFEKIIFITAIVAFIIHFIAIILANSGLLSSQISGEEQYQNPIISIYTPFTIILLFEIYSLIYYLPKSINIYLGKQFEIVTLILIRKIFNELANLTSLDGLYDPERIRQLLFTFAGLIVILLLIFCFYKLSGNKDIRADEQKCKSRREAWFIIAKKLMAIGLMLLFIFLFIKSIFDLSNLSFSIKEIVSALKTVNDTFFFTFFTALILVEVLLLLFTFNLSDKFHKVIRNSGFIISTILLKLSFRATGKENIIIILTAIGFGVAVMAIYRLYDKKLE